MDADLVVNSEFSRPVLAWPVVGLVRVTSLPLAVRPPLAVASTRGRIPARAAGTPSSVARTPARADRRFGLLS